MGAASRTLETRVGNGRGTSHPGGILNVDKQGWQASHKDRPRDKEQWAKERKRTMKAWEREEQELAWESSLAKKLKKRKNYRERVLSTTGRVRVRVKWMRVTMLYVQS